MWKKFSKALVFLISMSSDCAEESHLVIRLSLKLNYMHKERKRPKRHIKKTRWEKGGTSWKVLKHDRPSTTVTLDLRHPATPARAGLERSLGMKINEKYSVAFTGNRTWPSGLEVPRSTNWATEDLLWSRRLQYNNRLGGSRFGILSKCQGPNAK